jgi:predicted HD phosphohydrolase
VSLAAASTLDELVEVLASLAGDPGELCGLSELDHGLQCACELALAHPDDDVLQVAGLVHDVGHRFGDDAGHGVLGAAFVRPVLGERVATLVELHVPAKRMLVAVDPSYRERLSGVSVASLELQGGPLTAAGVDRFGSSRWAADALELRRADDRAKEPARPVPGLEAWLPLLAGVAARWTAG